MKATGVVVEYNPFHNGHKYHLEKAKSLGQGDVIVAAMSGNFIQRGEPAFINKWKRAEMALKSGVDIVAELPVYYSNQSAEIFSMGAVGILDKLKVNNIVFGSESGDVEKLKRVALLEENKDFQECLRSELEKGESYPTSFSRAVEKVTGHAGYLSPNDILGTEYVRSILKKGLAITSIAIKREGTGYHSHEIEGEIASATAIRRMLKNSEGEKIKRLVPETAYEILLDEDRGGRTALLKEYYQLIRHEIILHKDSIGDIQDVEEGFENRLYKSALKNRSFENFYSEILSKRYTNARIQRILTHTLLGVTKQITEEAKKGVPYVRILGFTEKGGEYLKSIKKESDTEIFTNLKNVTKKLSRREKMLLDFDEKCNRIYSIVKEYEDMKKPILVK